MTHYSLLVPCEKLIPTGGLLRFERFGRQLKKLGHELCFSPLTESVDSNFKTVLEVLSEHDASKLRWDAVMIPGAGFSEKFIERLNTYNNPKYGLRVQHILNDMTKKDSFVKVNRVFQPDIVIFNNPYWKMHDNNELQAKSFHHLYGSVDLKQFYPKKYNNNLDDDIWIIGGLTNKNPEPLIETLKVLPKNYQIKLFGPKRNLEKKFPKFVQEGRLQLVGSVSNDDLTSFYHSVDCIVHTEQFAGWANIVAEGMACGLPVICTSHGTEAFVKHMKNAIVIDEPNYENIEKAIRKLSKNPILCSKLADMARQTMLDYSWEEYAKKMLKIVFS